MVLKPTHAFCILRVVYSGTTMMLCVRNFLFDNCHPFFYQYLPLNRTTIFVEIACETCCSNPCFGCNYSGFDLFEAWYHLYLSPSHFMLL